ncbi:hypothetical protein D3C79_620830 [compost metagenome]
MNTNTASGKPGSKPTPSASKALTPSTKGLPSTWLSMLRPRFCSSPLTRVTMNPAPMAISNAGICATRPSPMVSRVKVDSAVDRSMPNCPTPMAMPPMKLTKMITMPAMASPLMNFMAPSNEPYSWLSRSSSLRLARAWAASMAPALRSPSMLICLPGMPSREKRAATSATRSEPLVITMNWTMVTIEKITKPTTRFSPITNSPNEAMISPASAWVRISRLVLIDRARRNRVVSSNRAGKVE